MKLGHTRAMIRAALSGELSNVSTVMDPVFGLAVPSSIRDVPPALLSPRTTWADPAAYDAQARILAQMFAKNFEQFADDVDAAVRSAGPRG
jgi:phosphoenolpyruvate carboxykinase (ATP)